MSIGKWLTLISSTVISVVIAATLWYALPDSASHTAAAPCLRVDATSTPLHKLPPSVCEQAEPTQAGGSQTHTSRPTHRSFSFHYLDILELLFGGEQKPVSRPNSSPQSHI